MVHHTVDPTRCCCTCASRALAQYLPLAPHGSATRLLCTSASLPAPAMRANMLGAVNGAGPWARATAATLEMIGERSGLSAVLRAAIDRTQVCDLRGVGASRKGGSRTATADLPQRPEALARRNRPAAVHYAHPTLKRHRDISPHRLHSWSDQLVTPSTASTVGSSWAAVKRAVTVNASTCTQPQTTTSLGNPPQDQQSR